MLQTLCVCADIPCLRTRTRLILIMHHNEADKPTNTGRLACLAIVGSDVRIRGLRDQRMSEAGIVLPDRRSLVLYPSEGARVLSRALAEEDPRPVTLIVPDATWNQAARTVRREPSLMTLERVCLPDMAASHLQMRANTRADGLSTIEAIAHAYGLLGEPEAQAALLALFELVVRRTLASRGVVQRP